MSSNKFTSTFFFRHLEIFFITGLIALYFHEEIINYFYNNKVVSLALIVTTFLFVILYTIATNSTKNTRKSNKFSYINDEDEEDDDWFSLPNLREYESTIEDIRTELHHVKSSRTVSNTAFCPDCGQKSQSHDNEFVCLNCDKLFDIEEEEVE